MDRLSQVAWLIRTGRQGATFDEIVAATKTGAITGQEAVEALEAEYDVAERQRQSVEIPCGMYLDEEAPGETLEDEALRRESSNLLLRILNDLPTRQRQCVELYYFDGMSQAEIGVRLCIGIDTVKKHLYRARERLSEHSVSTFSPQEVRIYSEGQSYYESIMQSWRHNARTAHPCLYPYELWSRYNAGTRQHANGRWTPIVQDRLREYICYCFGDNCGIVKPYKY